MPYEYLDDIAISDVAFHAWGNSMGALFIAAAQATLNVMVGNLDSIEDRVRYPIKLDDASDEMLLFGFLQELIFLKDAEQLLLCVPHVEILKHENIYHLTAEAPGEKLDPLKHDLIVDVKAVTLHRFNVKQTPEGWEATVILDI
jgi:SHS2 domain-containing protein